MKKKFNVAKIIKARKDKIENRKTKKDKKNVNEYVKEILSKMTDKDIAKIKEMSDKNQLFTEEQIIDLTKEDNNE